MSAKTKSSLVVGFFVAATAVGFVAAAPRHDVGGKEMVAAKPPMLNRLAGESSPYLLQHADNPVDWYPWGPEAIERARREDKPIFLSIGYSACHWCHVMERESFSDPDIARIMNKNFINIKVDREERPDIDEVYMTAVQTMTGRGGWPLTVFLTPDLKPFFGGTYFPRKSRGGTIGLPDLLERGSSAYRERRADIAKSGEAVAQSLKRSTFRTGGLTGDAASFPPALLAKARKELIASLDEQYGGFGPAPKFPQVAALLFLLEERWRTGDKASLHAVEITLRKMAAGGIQDQLGGGFHRYSVDRQWLVPHFEKMLYDNALLARTYVRAWQTTGKDEYARTARATLDFLLREMRDPAGGFYSAMDADSEHEEGAYYVWTLSELKDALGKDAARRFAEVYGVTRRGNFEDGKNVLHRAADPADVAREAKIPLDRLERELAESRARLLKVREKRARPATDTKILTSWNGMAIGALSLAGMTLGEERYTEAARRAADYILTSRRTKNGLARGSAGGKAGGDAFLDDYAYLVNGLLDLHAATLEGRYLVEADRLAREMLERFDDPNGDGLFYSAAPRQDAAGLPTRPRKVLDGSVPSPTSAAYEAVVRLKAITGDKTYAAAADGLEKTLAVAAGRSPGAAYYAMKVADMTLRPRVEVVVIGPAGSEAVRSLLREARTRALPGTALLSANGQTSDAADRLAAELLKGKTMVRGTPAAYVCRGRMCFPPVTDPGKLRELLIGILP